MEIMRITSQEQLDALLDAGADAPVFLLKHSTACPVSAAAKVRFEAYADAHKENMPRSFLLHVIEERPLSNRVAQVLGVRHQSPQLILVKSAEAVWSTSHHGIHAECIDESKSFWGRD